MDNGRIVWNPSSLGFAIEDSLGSGQSGRFSYVDISGSRARRLETLRRAAERLYLGRFKCPSGSYLETFLDGWSDPHHVRLVVQEGVHSERCVHADPDEVEIGVIGDPVNGTIDRVLSQAQLGAEWCAALQRREFGYCYDEASAKSPR